jgi:hypothetical protein
VAPRGPLLLNGYASSSSFIGNDLNFNTATDLRVSFLGNDYNGTLPRNLIGEYCNRTLPREISQRNKKTRKPTTEQLKAVSSIR